MRIRDAARLESRAMRGIACGTAVAVLLLLDRSPKAAQKQEVIVVDRPTVVAFFPSMTEAEMDKDPDANEALADFQLYAGQARKRLEAAGIQFQEIYANSFTLQIRGKRKTFRPKDIQVGYYFVAPDKPPRIQYGVMTDVDILAVAAAYFRLPTKP